MRAYMDQKVVLRDCECNRECLVKMASSAVKKEGEAISSFARDVPVEIADVISVIADTKGRVITSAVGKSGYIAKKMAATLCAVGAPSFFIHPTEAVHGDMGAICDNDALVIISNSGETAELFEICRFAKGRKITIITITSGCESFLAAVADITLLIPKSEEVCSTGLLPTTSAALTNSVCDAIAVCVGYIKGFDKGSYRERHIGGRIGKILLSE
ncbi:KpsF/GutQ family sugar-phosphate isomerase [Candidatus Hydrogenosomobacter endosymbioticus]|uniref:KpsF/GutQ family sugar-phosphate isomerase n=1 Tax=Candidatus Hydrogenosomobacter endosymbioticus TaxID=2558174 RepID=UPI001F2EDCC2|nr:SIS domain-containing protein [Candidatus Hydrogenosomobacter endosymbioticus]